MKKILVTGATGLVGSRYIELFPDKNQLLTPNEKELDITSLESLEKFAKTNDFESIVNFAAYTNVGEAEVQKETAWQLNVEAVRNLASLGVYMIQISTDMVFSGSAQDPGPYAENHPIESDQQKVNWYGWTKGQGEKEVPSGGAIVRIGNPVRAHFDQKPDYLRKVLKLCDQGKLYPFFDDQQVSVTFIDEASLAIQKILAKNLAGVFHVSSADLTTPFEIYSYWLAKVRPGKSKPIATHLPENNRYPKFGGLKSEVTEKQLGMKFKKWQEIIDELIRQGAGQ